MWKTVIKVGVALVSASITAILTAKDVLELATPFGFQVPSALIAFVIFLCFVIWWIWGLETYKHQIETSKPKLEVSKIGEWQFHQSAQPVYRAVQVWFVNRPRVASDASIAKDVAAVITFYDRNTKIAQKIFGCFTEAEVPDYATIAPPQNLKDKIEIWPPNGLPQKLLIGLKYSNDESAYGYARSNFSVAQNGREAEKELKKGDHYVQVRFSGTRINQPPFWFILHNPGYGGNLSLTQLTAKPDLQKEGFQLE